jgi:type II secretion system protein I
MAQGSECKAHGIGHRAWGIEKNISDLGLLISNKTSGFTLIEVLVAVAILAIAMVAILKANVQNLDALTKSRERRQASWRRLKRWELPTGVNRRGTLVKIIQSSPGKWRLQVLRWKG